MLARSSARLIERHPHLIGRATPMSCILQIVLETSYMLSLLEAMDRDGVNLPTCHRGYRSI